jgi:hypothetical protein
MKSIAERGNMPQLLEIEKQLKESGNTVDLPLEHLFVDGMYARTMFVPAGTVVVGKIHHKEDIGILMGGKAKFLMGNSLIEIEAPKFFKGNAGVKRLMTAITDCTYVSISRVETEFEGELDDLVIGEFEKELVSDSVEQYEQFLLENQS